MKGGRGGICGLRMPYPAQDALVPRSEALGLFKPEICWALNKSARGRTSGAWSLPHAEVKNEEYVELYLRCRMRHNGNRAKWRSSDALDSYSRGTRFESRAGHRSLRDGTSVRPQPLYCKPSLIHSSIMLPLNFSVGCASYTGQLLKDSWSNP
jgi:hypothetical protein